MDLVGMILSLPLAPFRGVVAVLGVLRDEAERELYDPSKLRSQAEEIEQLAASGEITAEEAERRQEELLEPLRATPPAGSGGE